MKCPKCKKSITNRSKVCRYCGVKIVRRSDKMAKKMTMDGGISMACGGLLILLGLVLVFNTGIDMWSMVAFGVGGALILIGKMMC